MYVGRYVGRYRQNSQTPTEKKEKERKKKYTRVLRVGIGGRWEPLNIRKIRYLCKVSI